MHVVGLRVCPVSQLGTQLPPQSVEPLGHWHAPPTHSLPSGHRLKQLPQWRSLVFRSTHPSLQRVLPSGQPQTLSSPRLMQFLEQHWESLLHSLPKRLQSSAQATPGTEANAAPRRAPLTNLIALPLEKWPFASPLASSSKEVAMEEPPEWGLGREELRSTSWLVWCSCYSSIGRSSSRFSQRCKFCILDCDRTWRNFRELRTETV